MKIERTIDIENEVQQALAPYFTIFPRPLPAHFKTPSLLVTLVGGDDEKKIDGLDIVLDARAKSNAEALNLLLDACAALKTIAAEQTTLLRYVDVNSIGSWGTDPMRPELTLATARLRIYTHKQTKII